MRSLDVFDMKRCDNPECLWSRYELMVDKTEVGDDGFQKVILISTLRCQCEAGILDKMAEVHEYVLGEEIGCLMDCD